MKTRYYSILLLSIFVFGTLFLATPAFAQDLGTALDETPPAVGSIDTAWNWIWRAIALAASTLGITLFATILKYKKKVGVLFQELADVFEVLGKRINEEINPDTGKPYNAEDIYKEIKDVRYLIRNFSVADTMKALSNIKTVATYKPEKPKRHNP